MSPLFKSLGIDRLSTEDRVVLVHEIWDSIAIEPAEFPLSAAQHEELERRSAAHRANPDDAIPWEEVLAAARERLRQ